MVIGGHTYEEVDTLIGGTLLTRAGKDLRPNNRRHDDTHEGQEGGGRGISLVPLAGYEPDPVFQKQVDACYANPELNRPMGGFGNAANKWGWRTGWPGGGRRIDAEIGFYHIGGVRLDSIPAGGVERGQRIRAGAVRDAGGRDEDDAGGYAEDDRFEIQRIR